MDQHTTDANEAPHIFTKICFFYFAKLEIDITKIQLISQLAKEKKKTAKYRCLVEALQKIQWAIVSAQRALSFDIALAKHALEKGAIVFDPMAQMLHEKELVDTIACCKAALDALSLFLNDLLKMNVGNKGCDLRRVSFKQTLSERDTRLKKTLDELSSWLDKEGQETNAIFPTRDKWLHSGIPETIAVIPLNPKGYIAIPRSLTDKFDLSVTKEYFFTQEFIFIHVGNTLKMFNTVLDAAREIESKNLKLQFQPQSEIESFFPITLTEEVQLKKPVGDPDTNFYLQNTKPI